MTNKIPLYFIGALVIASGIAMVKWGLPSQRDDDRSAYHDQNWSSFNFDFRIGYLTVTTRSALVTLGGYCSWDASKGWNTDHLLKKSFRYFNKNRSTSF